MYDYIAQTRKLLNVATNGAYDYIALTQGFVIPLCIILYWMTENIRSLGSLYHI